VHSVNLSIELLDQRRSRGDEQGVLYGDAVIPPELLGLHSRTAFCQRGFA
jgi:hypothetical protein